MSAVVDERVVEMRFDNKQFESNVQTSMSTLEKLKKSLNLSGASKGLENVSSAAKKVDVSGIGSAVDTVRMKFSALEVMGVTALANITNTAVNAGKRIAEALTIEPIKSGFEEYETQINAVQTILANTSSKGTTLDQVNAALDELNHYADMTIYNFTEMTRNIGTFTAAGVDLDTSVSAIKGIANLAAVSGSTSQQASTAMYQLSQALAAGTVKLMDWNSVVNAGMGGQVFQDALKDTARVHGIAIDQMIKDEGSFRETLSKGWLSSEILTETLSKFTGDLTEAQIKSMGYTDEQTAAIIKMGQTANDAATKVKTFTQLFDTLKEAAQSGWTQSWEILVGDFEEAKELLTGVSDVFSKVINDSANSRNELLEGAMSSNWDKLIGKINEAGVETDKFQENLKTTMAGHGIDVDKQIETYGSLEKVFTSGSVSSDILKEAVDNLNRSLTDLSSIEETLRKGSTGEDVTKIQEVLSELGYDLGNFGVDGIFGSATENAIRAFQEANNLTVDGIIGPNTINALEKASASTEKVVDSCDSLIDSITELGGRELLIDSIKNGFEGIVSIISPVKEAFHDIFPPTTSEQLYDLIDGLHEFSSNLIISEETADKIRRTFKGVFSIFDIGKKGISAVGNAIADVFKSEEVADLGGLFLDSAASLGDFLVSLDEKFDSEGLSGVLSVLSSGVSDFIGTITGGFHELSGVLPAVCSTVSNALGTLWDVFKTGVAWITDHVSIGDVFAGLTGTGIFLVAKKLSGILGKVQDILSSLFDDNSKLKSGAGSFSEILDSLHGALESFTMGLKVTTILGIAVAVGVLVHAIKSLSEIKADDIAKSLTAVGTLMVMLNQSLKSMTKTLTSFSSKGIIKSAAALILVSTAVNILVGAVKSLSELSFTEIGKGLTGVGGGLAELAVALKIIGETKVSLSTSIAMLALAKSCEMLSIALNGFSGMSWEEIGRGLSGMGGALGEVVAAVFVLGRFGGIKSLLGSGGIAILVSSLGELAESLKQFGGLSWEEIGHGLSGMGGALAEVIGTVVILSRLAGFSSVFASGAILITIQGLAELSEALKQFGQMQWAEITHGLVGMGGALSEVAIVSGTLGKLTGLSGVLGSGSLLLGIQGLSDLALALGQFGGMSWDEITHGLVGMGGALSEVAVVSGALGSLAGISGLLGSGSLLLGIQGLGDLADALKKFGTMPWDEIGKGLAAMGAAMGETAIGGLLNTLSGFGAKSIATIAEPLGTLADSIKKWSDVTVPEGLGGQLGSLAGGILKYTFDGVGATALATAAPAVGILAESVKKWAGVTVPDELGSQIGSLAGGIKKFTFGGMGAGTLSEAAPAVGTLAESVKKWSEVTIPDDLEATLSGLAAGVQAFTWCMVGEYSLGNLVTPLSNLADSVNKWNGITIPSDLKDGLTGLAEGVKEFTFGGLGASTMGEVATAMGSLATATSKWSGVTIPDDLENKLVNLASAVKAFKDEFGWGGLSDSSAGPLSNLADSVKKWNGVTIPDGIGSKLTSLASGISSFNGIDFESVSSGLLSVITSLKDISNLDTSGIESFSSVMSALGSSGIESFTKSFGDSSSKLSSIGSSLTDSLTKGISSKQSSLTSTATSMIGAVLDTINGRNAEFTTAGSSSIASLIHGFMSLLSTAQAATASIARGAISGITQYYNAFYSAGSYLVSGFVSGIQSNISSAASAAAAMAASASAAAKANLKIKSPSKVFYGIGDYAGQGFVNALRDYSSLSYQAGSQIADSARNGLSSAIGKLSDLINNNVDMQPTIRPVIDLSNVKSGASTIGNLLGLTPSVGVMSNVGAISSMMHSRIQNGETSEVVSAINKLRKDLGNVGGTSYNINGITYEDGSSVANAIKTIIRAANIERRA